MKIYLYIKGEKVYYYKNNEKGELLFENLENFIKDNRKKLFVLIFSKLNIFFRKVEFEFRDNKKISLILNQEIEGKLPLPIDNFYFYLNFHYPEKDKTIVGVFAIEKDKINYLKKIFKTNKAKYIFSIDSILIDQFFKKKINKENNFIEFFVEDDYFLANIIENSAITGIYSYSSDNINGTISEILPSLFLTKKLPIYFIGNRKTYEEIKIEGIHFLSEMNFLNILEEVKIKSISFQEILSPKRKINFEYISYLLLLVIFTSFFTNPHFKMIEKEKKIEEINKKMEDLYKSIFPETKKVVNPLIQIKEKMMENKGYSQVAVYKIPIIKILEEITTLFPENINAEVEEVSINNKNINLVCIVENLKNLDIVMKNLTKSKFFVDFAINDISFTKENKVKFNILLKIEL